MRTGKDNSDSFEYPYGDKVFIGIIKFYDSEKDFGFIESNGYGMHTDISTPTSFYLNHHSWLTEKLEERTMVVFRPCFNGSRTNASEVRLVDFDNDMSLIFEYYENNDVIEFEAKEKVYRYGKYGKPCFDGYRIEKKRYIIHSSCRVERWQLIDYCRIDYLLSLNFPQLLERIGTIIKDNGGNVEYNKVLRYSSKDQSSWQNLFKQLTPDLSFEVIRLYPCVQMFAPDDVLMENLDFIDVSWGVSPSVKERIDLISHKKELCQIEALIDDGFSNISRTEIDRIYADFLPELSKEKKAIVVDRREEIISENIKSLVNNISVGDFDLFKKSFSIIEQELDLLRSRGKQKILKVIHNSIEEVFCSFIESMVDEGSSPVKTDLLEYVLSNSVLLSNKILKPKNLLKQYVLINFEKIIIESLNAYEYIFFEERYSCLFDQVEMDELKFEFSHKLFDSDNLVMIGTFCEHYRLQLPDQVKNTIISVPFDKMVENISLLRNFKDHGLSIVGEVFDKFFLSNTSSEDFFRKDTEGELLFKEAKDFVQSVVYNWGDEVVEPYLSKLSYNDRLYLYENQIINVLTDEELESILLGKEKSNVLTDEEIEPFLLREEESFGPYCRKGKRIIFNYLRRLEYTSKDEVETALLWVPKYIDTEPSGYYDNLEWKEEKKKILDLFVQTGNERLKVIVWSIFFETKGKMSVLKDVYWLMPIQHQIKVLKRLFYAMSIKALEPSIDLLHNILGSKDHRISLAVAIVLKFLEMKKENTKSYLTNSVLLSIMQGFRDYEEWKAIVEMLKPCYGRTYYNYKDWKDPQKIIFSAVVKTLEENGKSYFRITASNHFVSLYDGNETKEKNTRIIEKLVENIKITLDQQEYRVYKKGNYTIIDIVSEREQYVRLLSERYKLQMDDVHCYELDTTLYEKDSKFCCQCRLSDTLDKETKRPFCWCDNKPCFCSPLLYESVEHWEFFTVLDFMRILSIPTDNINKKGKKTLFGEYVIFSSFIQSFDEFISHLKCRSCGSLMAACNISNFALSAVTEFCCTNPGCKDENVTVYLNRCFNSECNSIIDSRDSKQCPNNSYICSICGACCSNRKFEERLENLKQTGGHISKLLYDAVNHQIGHWETDTRFCYRCGTKFSLGNSCPKCYNSDSSSVNLVSIC